MVARATFSDGGGREQGRKNAEAGRGPHPELRHRQREGPASPFVPVSERGALLSTPGFVPHGRSGHHTHTRRATPAAISSLTMRTIPRDPSLPRSPQHSEHDALYRLGATAV
jgi:hypothetical protein